MNKHIYKKAMPIKEAKVGPVIYFSLLLSNFILRTAFAVPYYPIGSWEMNTSYVASGSTFTPDSSSSGSGNDLHLRYGAIITTGGQGIDGEALYLNGGSSNAWRANLWPGNGSIYLEMKIKPETIGATWTQIFHLSNVLSLRIRSDGAVNLNAYDSINGWVSPVGTQPVGTVKMNQWNIISLKIDLDGNVSLIWDGVPYTGAMPNTFRELQANVIIGGTGSSHTYKGFVDEVLIGFIMPEANGDLTPLPRIKARSANPVGEFYNSSNDKRFYPEGVNFVRVHWLQNPGSPFPYYHAFFSPGIYDPQDIEVNLSKIASDGWNMVRAFIFQGDPSLRNENPPIYSIEGPYDTSSPTLYWPYMANLLDFLERCTRHGIYALLVCDRVPYNQYYLNTFLAGDPDIEWPAHRLFMAPGGVAAKKEYMQQLIRTIKGYNPALLSTIFAYEIQNEFHIRTDYKPFNMTSGLVTTANGQTYDMALPVSRQACLEENTTYWISEISSVIKAEDPDAMVSVSTFSFYDVGKNGKQYAGMLPINMTDVRWPVRPQIFVESALDYVDIHMVGLASVQGVLTSSEWNLLNIASKPFYVGEYSSGREYTLKQAAAALYNQRNTFYSYGFSGCTHFLWDELTMHRWATIENNELINRFLKPKARWYWNFDFEVPVHWWVSINNMTATITQNNIINFEVIGTDPYFILPQTRIDTDDFRYLNVKLKNSGPNQEAQFFWTTESDPIWNEAKSHKFLVIPNDSDFREYVVDLTNNPFWTGIVKQVRFDPVQNTITTGGGQIDSIYIQPESERVKGDLTADGQVNLLDVVIFSQNWLQENRLWEHGDFNNSLTITLEDLKTLAKQWLINTDR